MSIFYFAWIDGPVPFDAVAHAVEDEAITELSLTQEEGNFAGLQITVVNPGEGLLAPGRLLWCWLSWDDGAGIEPLFTGRLVAVPEALDGEAVRLLFAAKPPDYDQIKADYADSLKVLPYVDLVWFLGDLDDPDPVLDAYGAQWHIDRVTLELSHSDELEGEDGVLEIGEADHTYEDFEQSYGDPPCSKVIVEGTLTWTQSGTGTIDLTKRITQEFKAQKTIYAYVDSYTGLITTLTGDGLMNAWPEGGTSFGGGWSVSNDTKIGDASGSFTRYELTRKYRGIKSDYNVEDEQQRGVSGYWLRSHQDYEVTYDVAAFEQHTLFDWEAAKGRTETIKFTLVADIQALLAEPDAEENIERITVNATDTVTEPDDAGVMPIGDKGRKAYLPTDRGADSVNHLMLLGRALLRRRSRAVEITCRVPFALGVQASLRASAHITDYRLPGGACSGKIISYELTVSGEGDYYGDLTIGCAIGKGGTIVPASGEPTYVDDGYVSDYQQRDGAQAAGPTSDIVYTSLDDTVIDDDGVDLLTLDDITAVDYVTVTNGLGGQFDRVAQSDDPANALNTAPTEICVKLYPVADVEFETDFAPTVEKMPIPRSIDLEAA